MWRCGLLLLSSARDHGTKDHGTMELIKKNIKDISRRRAAYCRLVPQSFHFNSIFKVGIYSSIKLTLIQTNYLQNIQGVSKKLFDV